MAPCTASRPTTYLAKAMEHALEEQGDDDDDGADGRDDPCRRVLERYLPCVAFPSSSHGQNEGPTSCSFVPGP